MMKKWFSILFICLLLIQSTTKKFTAESYATGYSEWSSEKTGDPNEVAAIQYGRKLPKEWSPWSTAKSTSLYQKSRMGETKHYAYDGELHYWRDVNAKTVFEINFGESAKITYLYVDVDTYNSNGDTYYQGPAMQAYCDNRLIASTGIHDVLTNWNPSVNCSCKLLKVNMSASGGNGRDTTMIVGSWATTTQKEYSYVVKWDEGNDWRFNQPYETKYGEESQLPTTRTVYSHPLKYKITYDLDGGEALDKLIYEYSILDEVRFPEIFKKGYEFLGFYENNIKIDYIPKGSHKNYNLTAKYKRKAPTIYVANYTFKKENSAIPMQNLLQILKPVAKDELDGDISKKVRVDSIYYVDENRTDKNPVTLRLTKAQDVKITFSVVNSGNQKTVLTKLFHILSEYVADEYVNDDVKIYSRYISEEYKDTLMENSIWRSISYSDLLNSIYEKMKGG